MRKNTIHADEPLTQALAMSLRRHSENKLTPAQQAVVEGLPDPERCRMEEALFDLTPYDARRLEGLTPAEIRRLLSGKLDADEVREIAPHLEAPFPSR